MPGLAMLVVAFFAAALTGMFKRVKNQKLSKGLLCLWSVRMKLEKAPSFTLMWNMKSTEDFM